MSSSNQSGIIVSIVSIVVILAALVANYLIIEPMEIAAARPRPEDIFIVSYPKSGSTFVRLLLGHLALNGRQTGREGARQLDLQTIEDLVPDLEYGPNRRAYTQPPVSSKYINMPVRLFKSHQAFGFAYKPPCDKSIGSSNVEGFQCACPNCPLHMKRIVYVVRDGRDTLCSYFHFQKKLGEFAGQGAGEFTEFLEKDLNEALYPGVRWLEHTRAYWEQSRNASSDQDIYLVRYEDLRDPRTALDAATKLASWAGLPSDLESVIDALERSGFQKMRKLEEANGLKLFDRHYTGREADFRLTRKGVVGGWRDDPACQLPDEQTSEFIRSAGPLLNELGYDY